MDTIKVWAHNGDAVRALWPLPYRWRSCTMLLSHGNTHARLEGILKQYAPYAITAMDPEQ